MAGERTFTEGEAYAIVAEAVERETAAANTKVTELEAQVVTLGNEKDALELRATAAEEKASTADKALEDYKSQAEAEKAMEAKRTERLAKVTEIAPKLEITDERANRIVAMADEVFTEYVDSLAAVAPPAETDADKDKGKGGEIPRESAAFKGAKAPESAKKGSVQGLFEAQRALHQPTTKSA